ncbi:vWA domain-containing protein, partial [Vibrio sp. ER1A]|uniref:vWA domain-containing protein n=1 Tax=Vibrio sp. ER1A TaxID=1517681 RepID=UPI000571C66D
MNFEFLYPQAFWLLLPVALVVAVKNYRQSSSSLIASHLEKALKLQSDSKKSAQFWLTLLCLVLITAIAGPSFETQTRPAFQSSSARVLVLDMSRSVYANDIKPSRLAQIKYKAQDLLPLITDGQTGLVAYAGDAYTLSPLTTDSATLGNLITNLSPEIMPFQGARADLAVKQAIDMMKQAGLSNGEIILFSDDLGQSELKAIEAMLSGHSWKLSVLAFGTTGGAPIALPDGSLLTDKSGNTVVAKTHFTNLEQAAKVGRGHYTTYRSDNQDISSLIQTSDVTANLKKEGEQSVDIRVNNGYWLLPLVLVLLLPLFRKGVVFCSPLLAILFGFNSNSAEASIIDSAFNNQNQLGYQAFQDKDYESAKNLFSNKQWLAAAQYENGDYQQAIDNLQGESDISALYNLGNAYAQHGELEKAADMYQQVLNQQPDQADAKFNLSLVQEAMKQQQQQQ